MMAKRLLVNGLLFAVALSAAVSAGAEDFIITVPVRMYNMVQGVGKVKVTCKVLDNQGQTIGAGYKWSTHGVNHYVTGLEEDIVLKFNASSGKDPRDATDYKCDLKVQLAWVTGEPWQTPSPDSNSMYLKPKPGTEFRVEDSGPLYVQSNIPKLKIDPRVKQLKR